ncbi:serine-rich adhesin for platelets-like [Parasteatoda tepidariorum]|uniref:serine-rich adhesin for platelets-like n=1 Tax=Parasteatoda tepidariorum TaxID=114398 RepID=UPI0039BCA2BC
MSNFPTDSRRLFVLQRPNVEHVAAMQMLPLATYRPVNALPVLFNMGSMQPVMAQNVPFNHSFIPPVTSVTSLQIMIRDSQIPVSSNSNNESELHLQGSSEHVQSEKASTSTLEFTSMNDSCTQTTNEISSDEVSPLPLPITQSKQKELVDSNETVTEQTVTSDETVTEKEPVRHEINFKLSNNIPEPLTLERNPENYPSTSTQNVTQEQSNSEVQAINVNLSVDFSMLSPIIVKYISEILKTDQSAETVNKLLQPENSDLLKNIKYDTTVKALIANGKFIEMDSESMLNGENVASEISLDGNQSSSSLIKQCEQQAKSGVELTGSTLNRIDSEKIRNGRNVALAIRSGLNPIRNFLNQEGEENLKSRVEAFDTELAFQKSSSVNNSKGLTEDSRSNLSATDLTFSKKSKSKTNPDKLYNFLSSINSNQDNSLPNFQGQNKTSVTKNSSSAIHESCSRKCTNDPFKDSSFTQINELDSLHSNAQNIAYDLTFKATERKTSLHQFSTSTFKRSPIKITKSVKSFSNREENYTSTHFNHKSSLKCEKTLKRKSVFSPVANSHEEVGPVGEFCYDLSLTCDKAVDYSSARVVVNANKQKSQNVDTYLTAKFSNDSSLTPPSSSSDCLMESRINSPFPDVLPDIVPSNATKEPIPKLKIKRLNEADIQSYFEPSKKFKPKWRINRDNTESLSVSKSKSSHEVDDDIDLTSAESSNDEPPRNVKKLKLRRSKRNKDIKSGKKLLNPAKEATSPILENPGKPQKIPDVNEVMNCEKLCSSNLERNVGMSISLPSEDVSFCSLTSPESTSSYDLPLKTVTEETNNLDCSIKRKRGRPKKKASHQAKNTSLMNSENLCSPNPEHNVGESISLPSENFSFYSSASPESASSYDLPLKTATEETDNLDCSVKRKRMRPRKKTSQQAKNTSLMNCENLCSPNPERSVGVSIPLPSENFSFYSSASPESTSSYDLPLKTATEETNNLDCSVKRKRGRPRKKTSQQAKNKSFMKYRQLQKSNSKNDPIHSPSENLNTCDHLKLKIITLPIETVHSSSNESNGTLKHKCGIISEEKDSVKSHATHTINVAYRETLSIGPMQCEPKAKSMHNEHFCKNLMNIQTTSNSGNISDDNQLKSKSVKIPPIIYLSDDSTSDESCEIISNPDALSFHQVQCKSESTPDQNDLPVVTITSPNDASIEEIQHTQDASKCGDSENNKTPFAEISSTNIEIDSIKKNHLKPETITPPVATMQSSNNASKDENEYEVNSEQMDPIENSTIPSETGANHDTFSKMQDEPHAISAQKDFLNSFSMLIETASDSDDISIDNQQKSKSLKIPPIIYLDDDTTTDLENSTDLGIENQNITNKKIHYENVDVIESSDLKTFHNSGNNIQDIDLDNSPNLKQENQNTTNKEMHYESMDAVQLSDLITSLNSANNIQDSDLNNSTNLSQENQNATNKKMHYESMDVVILSDSETSPDSANNIQDTNLDNSTNLRQENQNAKNKNTHYESMDVVILSDSETSLNSVNIQISSSEINDNDKLSYNEINSSIHKKGGMLPQSNKNLSQPTITSPPSVVQVAQDPNLPFETRVNTVLKTKRNVTKNRAKRNSSKAIDDKKLPKKQYELSIHKSSIKLPSINADQKTSAPSTLANSTMKMKQNSSNNVKYNRVESSIRKKRVTFPPANNAKPQSYPAFNPTPGIIPATAHRCVETQTDNVMKMLHKSTSSILSNSLKSSDKVIVKQSEPYVHKKAPMLTVRAKPHRCVETQTDNVMKMLHKSSNSILSNSLKSSDKVIVKQSEPYVHKKAPMPTVRAKPHRCVETQTDNVMKMLHKSSNSILSNSLKSSDKVIVKQSESYVHEKAPMPTVREKPANHLKSPSKPRKSKTGVRSATMNEIIFSDAATCEEKSKRFFKNRARNNKDKSDSCESNMPILYPEITNGNPNGPQHNFDEVSSPNESTLSLVACLDLQEYFPRCPTISSCQIPTSSESPSLRQTTTTFDDLPAPLLADQISGIHQRNEDELRAELLGSCSRINESILPKKSPNCNPGSSIDSKTEFRFAVGVNEETDNDNEIHSCTRNIAQSSQENNLFSKQINTCANFDGEDALMPKPKHENESGDNILAPNGDPKKNEATIAPKGTSDDLEQEISQFNEPSKIKSDEDIVQDRILCNDPVGLREFFNMKANIREKYLPSIILTPLDVTAKDFSKQLPRRKQLPHTPLKRKLRSWKRGEDQKEKSLHP